MLPEKFRKHSAFSLVELLIILAVIAAIAIFSSVNVLGQRRKARDAVRKTDLIEISNALDEYQELEGCYPQTLPSCDQIFSSSEQKLLDSLPCDPLTASPYIYVAEGADCPQWFQLYTNLEDTRDQGIDRVGCRNGCGPDNCAYNYGVSSPNKKLDTCELPPRLYACAPNKTCIEYADPALSSCPVVFPNDSTCLDLCEDKNYRCHDERGKRVPGNDNGGDDTGGKK